MSAPTPQVGLLVPPDVLAQPHERRRHYLDRAVDAGIDHLAVGELADDKVLDLLLLAGWCHAISYAANAARVPPRSGPPGSPSSADRPAR